MNTIVVDANVIAKTFIEEYDSKSAIDFLRACVSKKIRILAPTIIQYEVAHIALKKGVSLDKVIRLFEQHIAVLVDIKIPDRFTWLQSEKICKQGHKKSGFPSMYDSIYHAMAIIEDGLFITADKRHYAKSKKFEHIVLMQDWEKVIRTM